MKTHKSVVALSTVDDWLGYIATRHVTTINLGLERVSGVAAQLACTAFSCPVVMVAGTNGKGSTVALLQAIFSDYRVGCYTSPHLHRFNERIVLNGKPIDDASLISAFADVCAVQSDKLSFFEYTTLAALHYFKQQPLDLLILEVGLGGRLDAVNVVDADVAVITSIGYDHTQWLGDSLQKIAYEKAGIIKPGCDVVCGVSPVMDVFKQRASQLQAQAFFQIGVDYQMNTRDARLLYSGEGQYDLPACSLRKDHAGSAIKVMERLALPVTASQVSRALAQVQLPGRFECWDTPIKAVFDVAHNPQATQYLAEQLAARFKDKKLIALVAMLEDKAIKETLQPLLPMIDRWYTANLRVTRGANNGQVIAALKTLKVRQAQHFSDISSALLPLMETLRASKATQLVVFGSFHTVAQAQQGLLLITRRQ